MNHSDPVPPANPTTPPAGRRIPLPLGKPFWVYVLLAAIIIVFIIEQTLPLFATAIIPLLPPFYNGVTPADFQGGSTSNLVLVLMGANFRPLVEQGQVWRFFTSMFLHIGFQHILFNAYALFIFGAETERIFGRTRFLVIYILSGLFGSLASFALSGATISAGASGAIFGIVGMQVAYFYRYREMLGTFGRSRLINVGIIVVINIFFGLSMPGIDNWAHLGGLISGTLIALKFMPEYKLVDPYTVPHMVDASSPLKQAWVPLLATALLAAGTFALVGV